MFLNPVCYVVVFLSSLYFLHVNYQMCSLQLFSSIFFRCLFPLLSVFFNVQEHLRVM